MEALDLFGEMRIGGDADEQPLSRAERRDQQTQRILEAAKTCFVRSGFQGASMQQICAEAGMSPGALYRYFSSKEAIIEAICEADRAEDAKLFRRDPQQPERRRRPGRRGDGAYPARARDQRRAAVCRDLRRSPCATRRSQATCMKNMERGV